MKSVESVYPYPVLGTKKLSANSVSMPRPQNPVWLRPCRQPRSMQRRRQWVVRAPPLPSVFPRAGLAPAVIRETTTAVVDPGRRGRRCVRPACDSLRRSWSLRRRRRPSARPAPASRRPATAAHPPCTDANSDRRIHGATLMPKIVAIELCM